MFNKILVFWGLAAAAVLIVENMVTWMSAYVFIDSSSKSWILALASVIVWFFIWYWAKWMLERDAHDDDNYDF